MDNLKRAHGSHSHKNSMWRQAEHYQAGPYPYRGKLPSYMWCHLLVINKHTTTCSVVLRSISMVYLQPFLLLHPISMNLGINLPLLVFINFNAQVIPLEWQFPRGNIWPQLSLLDVSTAFGKVSTITLPDSYLVLIPFFAFGWVVID